jgi:hypothetical protein
MDDGMENSMELHESNTVATSAQSKSKASSIISGTQRPSQGGLNSRNAANNADGNIFNNRVN